MKIPWDFFARRRGYNLSNMIDQEKFKNYEDYVDWCNKKDVVPVAETDFKALSPGAKPKVTKPKVTKPEPVLAKKKIKGKTRTKKVESGNKTKVGASSRSNRKPAIKKS
tara:strand:+ start:119 stop:445 length:327 start_codon:yes stop_codon:yes gene_type:complete